MPTPGQGLGALFTQLVAPGGAGNPAYAQEIARLGQADSARSEAELRRQQVAKAVQDASDARGRMAGRQRLADYYRANGNELAALAAEAATEGNFDQLTQGQGNVQKQGFLAAADAAIPAKHRPLGEMFAGPPAPDVAITPADVARYQLKANLAGVKPFETVKVEGGQSFDPTGITGTAVTPTALGDAMIRNYDTRDATTRRGQDLHHEDTLAGFANQREIAAAHDVAAGQRAASSYSGKAPPDYVWNADHTALVFTPGGRADPATIKAQAEAKASAKSGTPQLTTGQRNAIGENDALVAQIDAAIANLKTPEGQAAVGYSFNAPNIVNDYRNPRGIPTRSTLSNFRSAVIHARSGAAVTASEMKNLAPFLPSAGEPAANSISKLQSMRRQVLAENDAIRNSVTPEALVAAAPSVKPAAGRPAPISGPAISAAQVTAEAVRRGKDPAAGIAAYKARGYTVTP